MIVNRKGVHRFKVDYVGTWAINFVCRKCPLVIVADKFELREAVQGKQPILSKIPKTNRCSN